MPLKAKIQRQNRLKKFMKNFRVALREELKNPEFKKEWDALEPEFRRLRKSLAGEISSPSYKAFKKFSNVRGCKIVRNVKIG